MEKKADLIENIKRKAYGGDLLDASVDDRDVEFFINDSIRYLCSEYQRKTGQSIAGEFEVEYSDNEIVEDNFGRLFTPCPVVPLIVTNNEPLRSVRPQSQLKCQNLDEFKLVKSSHLRLTSTLESGWMEGMPYAWLQQNHVYLQNINPTDWKGEKLMITLIPNVRYATDDTFIGVSPNVYEDFIALVVQKVIQQKNTLEDKVKDLNDEQQ